MRRLLLLFVGVLAARSSGALAVDEKGVKIADKWSVVGVISEDEQKGIVVLKNNVTNKTFTLAIGDDLPTEFGFVVLGAKRRAVIIGNGKEQVTLAFAESSTTETEEAAPLTPTGQFLDHYYRGLSESPVEILGPASENEPDRVESQAGLALKRFGTMKEEGRSRFELYRADRSYRSDPEAEGENQEQADEGEDSGESGFVVNYDNFDDADSTEGEDGVQDGAPVYVPLGE